MKIRKSVLENQRIVKTILSLFCISIVTCVYAQDKWTQKAVFGGSGRYAAVGFSIADKGYIGTGYTLTDGNTQDLWEWNQLNNTWTQKANFPGAGRNQAAAFSIGKKGYIGTGYAGGIYTNDFWEWDQVSNTWSQIAPFAGTARCGAVAFSIGSKGYVGTGNDGSEKSDFWEWDQASNSWSKKADCGGGGRFTAVGFSIKNKGYIGTGAQGLTLLKDFWEWDQAKNTWIQKADFPGLPRHMAVGFSIGTKGFIGTGRNAPNYYLQDLWQWDQLSNTWTSKANFIGSGRNQAAGFAIGNKGYIGTGNDGGMGKDLWEYDSGIISGITEMNSKSGQEAEINVYPNPANNQDIIIHYNLPGSQKSELLIMDLQGKQIKSYLLEPENNQIKISNGVMASGVYIYRIKTGNEIITSGKIIIAL